jgi:arylsulfatase A-like enzyme
LDGQSLVSLIRGDKHSLNRPFLAWWYPHPQGHGRQPCKTILKDGWKLVHYIEQNETELYNLDKDVGEKNDLVEAQPEKTRELLETLNLWIQQTQKNN